MKITIVTGPWLPVPAIQGGAVERRWQGVAEEFVQRGQEVTFICRAFPDQPSTESINGVRYIRKSGFSQSNSIVWDLLKDFLYALNLLSILPPADVIVINDFWLPVLAALRPRVGKLVLEVARFPKHQHWLYFGASSFIVTSHAIASALIKQNPYLKPLVKVIPNPINTNAFYPPSEKILDQGRKEILYVGRIHKEKGIHLLVSSFSLLVKSGVDCQLRIIGPYYSSQGGSGEGYYASLREQSSNLPVEFSKPIFDVEELAEAYRQADIFCYPSLAEQGESFGVAPLEAMACGLVPVVSGLDCFRDFIEENITGYFFDHRSPNAAENLANTLLKAINKWETTLAMREKAIQKAQEFSCSNIADLCLAEFEVLNNEINT